MASYYSGRFSGRRTASGERFDPSAMTAAHMTLPLGTKVRITNLKNGQSVVVRINDRGGFRRHGRILDLSPAAARPLLEASFGTWHDAAVAPTSPLPTMTKRAYSPTKRKTARSQLSALGRSWSWTMTSLSANC